MQHRIPGFGAALGTSLSLVLSGCGGAAAQMKAEATMAPAVPPTSAAAPTSAGAPGQTSGMPGIPGSPGSTPSEPSGDVTLAPTREMLDIEANANVEVAKLKPALRLLHELAGRVGGVITSERVDTTSTHGSAQLTLRVPSRATSSVLQELEQLGKVLEQTVTARDIGKEYFDASLRLSSLTATLHRYEEILSRADKVEEVLRIEQELARVRAEIEQIKGNLRWLSDRAARATLHLTLRERAPQVAYSPAPEAKFFPGLRAGTLLDFGARDDRAHVGGGLSLRVSRALSLDLDLFERLGSDARGPDAVLATLGGEVYSELLGGGERRFFNPYLGWRVGYARFHDDDEALLGATVGLELYKSPWFGLDVEARNYLGLFGDEGAHYELSPALGARVAF